MIYLVNLICCLVVIFHASSTFAEGPCSDFLKSYSPSAHDYCDTVICFSEHITSKVESDQDSNWNIDRMKFKYENIFGKIVSEKHTGRAQEFNSDCFDRTVREVYYAKGARLTFWDGIGKGCDDKTDLDCIEYTGAEELLPYGIKIGDNKSKITNILGPGEEREHFTETGERLEMVSFECDLQIVVCYFKENSLVKVLCEFNNNI